MSDSTQGPGWWQASDGKWYPPEEHPGYQAPTEAMASTPPPPTQAMPSAPPPGPPPGAVPPPPGPGGPGGPPPAGNSNARWIVVGAIAAVVIILIAFLLLRDDDKKSTVAANSSASSQSSESSESSKSSSRSSSSRSTSSSSATEIGDLSESELEDRLVRAKDLGPEFEDSTPSPDDEEPTPCGGPNINQQVPPELNVGSEAQSDVAFFAEEVYVYGSEADAKQVMALAEAALSCPSPTFGDGSPLAASGPNDVSDAFTVSVDEAIAFTFESEQIQGTFVFVRIGNAVMIFAFGAQTGTDISLLPNEGDVINDGLERLTA